MSDLIRGGQVTLHKFRMLMQVNKIIARICLVLVLISIGYSFYKNLSGADWKVGLSWVKKDILLALDSNRSIRYLNEQGFEKTLKAKEFHTDPYVLKVVAKFDTTFYKAIYLSAFMVSATIAGILIFFWIKGRRLKLTTRLRGVFLTTPRALKKQLKKHNEKFKEYRAFEVADFAYPISGRPESWTAGEQSHTLFVGSTGAGKTQMIQHLVTQLHKRNQKAIIIDIKGDYIQHFYRKQKGDIILNPLDKRGRNWSIFNETNALKGFANIAKSLLPTGSKNDPIWSDAARGVLAEMANLYVSEGLSLSAFADKLLKQDLSTLTKLLEKTSAAKVINEDIEKAALSVLMVLSTYLKPLKLYRSAEDCFSITDWINDEQQNNFLFISSCADVKEDLNPLVSAQVDIAVNALRSLQQRSNCPKIWFILDELPYFENSIPSLKDGLATVRSYGGCFVLGTQDMSSLAKIYSDKTAESIANNCRTKIILNIAGKESGEWCSHSLGEGEIEEWHEGLSYGSHEMRDGVQVNHNRVIRRTVLASEFTMLKTGEGYIKFAGFEATKFKFDNCYFKKVAAPFEENNELYTLFQKELEEGEERRREIEAKLNKLEDKESSLKEITISKKPAREKSIEAGADSGSI